MKVMLKFITLIFVFLLWIVSIFSYKNIGGGAYEGFMVTFGTISFVSMVCLFIRFPLMIIIKHTKNQNYKKYSLKLLSFFTREHLFFAIITITALIEHNLFYFLYHSSNIVISTPCIIGYIAIGLFIINLIIGEMLRSKHKIKNLFKIHKYIALAAIVFIIIHVLLMN